MEEDLNPELGQGTAVVADANLPPSASLTVGQEAVPASFKRPEMEEDGNDADLIKTGELPTASARSDAGSTSAIRKGPAGTSASANSIERTGARDAGPAVTMDGGAGDKSAGGEDDQDSDADSHYDHCNSCKQGEEGETLLLCDRCPRAYHLHCLGLTAAPGDDQWYCDWCRAVLARQAARDAEKAAREADRAALKRKRDEEKAAEVARKEAFRATRDADRSARGLPPIASPLGVVSPKGRIGGGGGGGGDSAVEDGGPKKKHKSTSGVGGLAGLAGTIGSTGATGLSGLRAPSPRSHMAGAGAGQGAGARKHANLPSSNLLALLQSVSSSAAPPSVAGPPPVPETAAMVPLGVAVSALVKAHRAANEEAAAKAVSELAAAAVSAASAGAGASAATELDKAGKKGMKPGGKDGPASLSVKDAEAQAAALVGEGVLKHAPRGYASQVARARRVSEVWKALVQAYTQCEEEAEIVMLDGEGGAGPPSAPPPPLFPPSYASVNTPLVGLDAAPFMSHMVKVWCGRGHESVVRSAKAVAEAVKALDWGAIAPEALPADLRTHTHTFGMGLLGNGGGMGEVPSSSSGAPAVSKPRAYPIPDEELLEAEAQALPSSAAEPRLVRDTLGLTDAQLGDALACWDFVKTFSCSNSSCTAGSLQPLLHVGPVDTGEALIADVLSRASVGCGTGVGVADTELSGATPLPIPSPQTVALPFTPPDLPVLGQQQGLSSQTVTVDIGAATLADFVAALRSTDFRGYRLLSRCHVCLLRLLLRDRDATLERDTGEEEERGGDAEGARTGGTRIKSEQDVIAAGYELLMGDREREQEPVLGQLSTLSWPEILRRALFFGPMGAYLRTHLTARACAIADSLRELPYSALCVADRLCLLKSLVDAATACDTFGNYLNDQVGARLERVMLEAESEAVSAEREAKEEIRALRAAAAARVKAYEPVVRAVADREKAARERAKEDRKKGMGGKKSGSASNPVDLTGSAGNGAAVSSSPFVCTEEDAKEDATWLANTTATLEEAGLSRAEVRLQLAAAQRERSARRVATGNGGVRKLLQAELSAAAKDGDIQTLSALLKRARDAGMGFEGTVPDKPRKEKTSSTGPTAGPPVVTPVGMDEHYAGALIRLERLKCEEEVGRVSEGHSRSADRMKEKVCRKLDGMRVRALLLGLDRYYRSYWLYNADRSRIWVEIPVDAAGRPLAGPAAVDWLLLPLSPSTLIGPTKAAVDEAKEELRGSGMDIGMLRVSRLVGSSGAGMQHMKAGRKEGQAGAGAGTSGRGGAYEDGDGIEEVEEGGEGGGGGLLGLSRPPSAAPTPLPTGAGASPSSSPIPAPAPCATEEAPSTVSSPPPLPSHPAHPRLSVGAAAGAPRNQKAEWEAVREAHRVRVHAEYPSAQVIASSLLALHAPETVCSVWACIDSMEGVHALLAWCDPRGVRERALSEALRSFESTLRLHLPPSSAVAAYLRPRVHIAGHPALAERGTSAALPVSDSSLTGGPRAAVSPPLTAADMARHMAKVKGGSQAALSQYWAPAPLLVPNPVQQAEGEEVAGLPSAWQGDRPKRAAGVAAADKLFATSATAAAAQRSTSATSGASAAVEADEAAAAQPDEAEAIAEAANAFLLARKKGLAQTAWGGGAKHQREIARLKGSAGSGAGAVHRREREEAQAEDVARSLDSAPAAAVALLAVKSQLLGLEALLQGGVAAADVRSRASDGCGWFRAANRDARVAWMAAVRAAPDAPSLASCLLQLEKAVFGLQRMRRVRAGIAQPATGAGLACPGAPAPSADADAPVLPEDELEGQSQPAAASGSSGRLPFFGLASPSRVGARAGQRRAALHMSEAEGEGDGGEGTRLLPAPTSKGGKEEAAVKRSGAGPSDPFLAAHPYGWSDGEDEEDSTTFDGKEEWQGEGMSAMRRDCMGAWARLKPAVQRLKGVAKGLTEVVPARIQAEQMPGTEPGHGTKSHGWKGLSEARPYAPAVVPGAFADPVTGEPAELLAVALRGPSGAGLLSPVFLYTDETPLVGSGTAGGTGPGPRAPCREIEEYITLGIKDVTARESVKGCIWSHRSARRWWRLRVRSTASLPALSVYTCVLQEVAFTGALCEAPSTLLGGPDAVLTLDDDADDEVPVDGDEEEETAGARKNKAKPAGRTSQVAADDASDVEGTTDEELEVSAGPVSSSGKQIAGKKEALKGGQDKKKDAIHVGRLKKSVLREEDAGSETDTEEEAPLPSKAKPRRPAPSVVATSSSSFRRVAPVQIDDSTDDEVQEDIAPKRPAAAKAVGAAAAIALPPRKRKAVEPEIVVDADNDDTDDDDVDDDDHDNECIECGRGSAGPAAGEEELLLCEGCPTVSHPSCAGLAKVPRGSWYCSPCKAAPCPVCSKPVAMEESIICGPEEEEDKKDSQSKKAGKKLGKGVPEPKAKRARSGCNAAFHLVCVHVREAPSGDWFCPRCSK